MSALMRLDQQPVPSAVSDRVEETIAKLLDAAYSSSTKQTQAGRANIILGWAEGRGFALPLNSGEAAIFIADLVSSNYALSTIKNLIAALRSMHRKMKSPDPTDHEIIRQLMRGVRRTTRQPKGKSPLLVEHIRASLYVAQADPNAARGVRDFSILCGSFAGANRVQDVRIMCVEHLERDSAGRFIRVLIPRSKTDQEGEGQEVTLYATGGPTCPVKALERWLALLGRSTGPVYCRIFKGGRIGDTPLTYTAVLNVFKHYVRELGLDPAEYGTHSSRIGFVTEGLRNEVPEVELMHQTRQKKLSTLFRYSRHDPDLNFSKRLGL